MSRVFSLSCSFRPFQMLVLWFHCRSQKEERATSRPTTAWDAAWRTWSRSVFGTEWPECRCRGACPPQRRNISPRLSSSTIPSSSPVSRTASAVAWIDWAGIECQRFWNRCSGARTSPSQSTVCQREPRPQWWMKTDADSSQQCLSEVTWKINLGFACESCRHNPSINGLFWYSVFTFDTMLIFQLEISLYVSTNASDTNFILLFLFVWGIAKGCIKWY